VHFTEYYAILERDLDVLNPTSHEALDRLEVACAIRDGTRVLDVGCGKAAMLRRWAVAHAIRGVGLEINPHFVAEAYGRIALDGVDERVRLVEGAATAFTPPAARFDVVTCLGAPFAIGTFDDAVAWMRSALHPGGTLAIGDRYLAQPLDAAAGDVPDDVTMLPSLAEVHARLEGHGLTVTALIGSSTADWDRYRSAGWTAARAWADENPEHPERATLLADVAAARERYLRYERRHVGWAIWVARVAAP
jgi:cyclopropane fatty-acyl-phospholipid synthase-like methyltransferase